MADVSIIHEALSRRLNQTFYGYGAGPAPVEVGIADEWDYIKYGGGLTFYCEGDNGWRREGMDLRFRVKQSKWMPNAEAIAELKALMASWRARGWDEQADVVEDEGGRSDSERGIDDTNIYGLLGSYMSGFVYILVPISECRFFRHPLTRALRAAFEADFEAASAIFRTPRYTILHPHPPETNKLIFSNGVGELPRYHGERPGPTKFVTSDDFEKPAPGWTCYNHPAGFEIPYSAEVEKCYCGTQRPKGG